MWVEPAQTPSRFEFRRHVDDLVYIFDKIATADGQVRYKRSDADLWVVCHNRHGWVVWDPATGAVLGRPWDIPPCEQAGSRPPAGDWVSKKGSKSYVYSLVCG